IHPRRSNVGSDERVISDRHLGNLITTYVAFWRARLSVDIFRYYVKIAFGCAAERAIRDGTPHSILGRLKVRVEHPDSCVLTSHCNITEPAPARTFAAFEQIAP